jgi:hypothetical protein
MPLYVATIWNGSIWADLHVQPEPFRIASEIAIRTLFSHRGASTRLRQVQ